MDSQEAERQARASIEQLCAYVADLTTELQRLARGHNLVVLAAMLNLVQAEAERLVREERVAGSR
jgi:hypothetical protein